MGVVEVVILKLYSNFIGIEFIWFKEKGFFFGDLLLIFFNRKEIFWREGFRKFFL